MSEAPDDEVLTPALDALASRAAEEGVPVAAIARILSSPFAAVMASLQHAVSLGTLIELPRSDWPPNSLKHQRLPAWTAGLNYADLMFLCRTGFRLTNLEAALMITLLKHERCDKMKLHNVVEQQRFARSSQPNSIDPSDPKMVDVMICKLRKKLKALNPGLVIETVWGGGYYIDTPAKDIAFSLLQQPTGAKPVDAKTVSKVSPAPGHTA